MPYAGSGSDSSDEGAVDAGSHRGDRSRPHDWTEDEEGADGGVSSSAGEIPAEEEAEDRGLSHPSATEYSSNASIRSRRTSSAHSERSLAEQSWDDTAIGLCIPRLPHLASCWASHI